MNRKITDRDFQPHKSRKTFQSSEKAMSETVATNGPRDHGYLARMPEIELIAVFLAIEPQKNVSRKCEC